MYLICAYDFNVFLMYELIPKKIMQYLDDDYDSSGSVFDYADADLDLILMDVNLCQVFK